MMFLKAGFKSKSLTSPRPWVEKSFFYKKLASFSPKRIVIFYSPLTFSRANNYFVEGDVDSYDIVEISARDKKAIFIKKTETLCILPLPIGAPYYAVLVEELQVLFAQVKEWILCGVAGALNTSLKIGDILIPKSALRGEGTSHYYLGDSQREVEADTRFLKKVAGLFGNSFTGKHFSTDAVFRETEELREFLLSHGIFSIDMETSCHFALAKYFGFSAVAVLVVSDRLLEEKWEKGFGTSTLKQGIIEVWKKICLLNW